MKELQLILTKGLPGSGKSTWAKTWVLEDPKERIRVNRDDIRRMLGPYWVPTREELVTAIERESIRVGAMQGYSVVVDATNFKAGWIEQLHKNMSSYSNVKLIWKDFTDVPVETCIERDKQRPVEEQVGEEIIRNMAKKYNVS